MGGARSRFSDFLNQEMVKRFSPVNIIGLGGIGSPIAESLSRIGFDLVVIDHDTVSLENIGAQHYGFPDLGKSKALVLKDRLEEMYRISVRAVSEKYAGQELLSGFTVCGVDSLEERANIWKEIRYNPAIPLYFDGRVGGERFKLFCLSPCDPELIGAYESHLDLSAPRSRLPCTSKFSPQAGMAIDWTVSCAIKACIAGDKVPFQVSGRGMDLRTVYL